MTQPEPDGNAKPRGGFRLLNPGSVQARPAPDPAEVVQGTPVGVVNAGTPSNEAAIQGCTLKPVVKNNDLSLIPSPECGPDLERLSEVPPTQRRYFLKKIKTDDANLKAAMKKAAEGN